MLSSMTNAPMVNLVVEMGSSRCLWYRCLKHRWLLLLFRMPNWVSNSPSHKQTWTNLLAGTWVKQYSIDSMNLSRCIYYSEGYSGGTSFIVLSEMKPSVWRISIKLWKLQRLSYRHLTQDVSSWQDCSHVIAMQATNACHNQRVGFWKFLSSKIYHKRARTG